MLRRVAIPLVVSAALSLCAAANAATIVLSDMSSDETPASALGATLEFTVSGSLLELTVVNQSEYEISAIYFNATDKIDGLSVSSIPAGWSLGSQEKANGFGTFDAAVLGSKQDQIGIGVGASETFAFTISGTGPFADTDFTTEASETPDGMGFGNMLHRMAMEPGFPQIAAAKFVRGLEDDSAFGGASASPVPEPHSVILFGVGALIVGTAVRRRLTRPS